MKEIGSSKDRIIEFIRKRGPSRVVSLVDFLGISPQAVHRHLKKLVIEGILLKHGAAPVVFYEFRELKHAFKFKALSAKPLNMIERYFFYVNPQGKVSSGLEGFQQWVVSIGQEKNYVSLAYAYEKRKKECLGFLKKKPYIIATKKIKNTFKNCRLDELIYQDFYSIPQFGKTKFGYKVMLGKSGQQLWAIRDLAKETKKVISDYIKRKKIQAILWIPHSIPRKLVFLKQYKKSLNLSLPALKALKAYDGKIPIAQKSLSKLSERIENARDTIFISETEIPFQRVLMIDDALGSGASMNETALKLKKQFHVSKVYGFAIVGSFKGFEVIRDV